MKMPYILIYAYSFQPETAGRIALLVLGLHSCRQSNLFQIHILIPSFLYRIIFKGLK
jgi:hypothetical protein